MRTLASFVTAAVLSVQAPQASLQPSQTRSAAPPMMRNIGSVSELMVDILYPASDAVLYIATRTPTTDAEWNKLQGQALMTAEVANLLMMPSRARDANQWMKDAKLLLDAGGAAFAAAKRKDVVALAALNDQLDAACVTCHQHYRPNYGRGR